MKAFGGNLTNNGLKNLITFIQRELQIDSVFLGPLICFFVLVFSLQMLVPM